MVYQEGLSVLIITKEIRMKKIALLMASIFSLGAQANTVEPEKYIAQSFSDWLNQAFIKAIKLVH